MSAVLHLECMAPPYPLPAGSGDGDTWSALLVPVAECYSGRAGCSSCEVLH